MSSGRINGALLGADDEIIHVTMTKAHGSDRNVLGLFALQFDGLLRRIHIIQCPRAHLSIVADTYQIVCIL